VQAIDQIVNSAGKTYYMVSIVFYYRSPGLYSLEVCRVRNYSPAVMSLALSSSEAPMAQLQVWPLSTRRTTPPGTVRSQVSRSSALGVQRTARDCSRLYSSVVKYSPALDSDNWLQAAIRDPNPVIFLENEILYGQSFPLSREAQSDDFLLPIGKAKIERAGSDVTIVGHSRMVSLALEAADRLEREEGVKAEVINLRSIRPLDIDTILQSVKKTNRYCLIIFSHVCLVLTRAKSVVD
jgi:pyruvate/2-oxoglutarate/acetoin dehydrogenase E1 component